MSGELLKELERYGRYADAAAPEIDVAEVLRETETEVRPLSRLRPMQTRPRRGLMAAAAATAVTIAFVGGAALLGLFAPEEVLQPGPGTTMLQPDEPDPFVVPDATPVEFLNWSSVGDAGLDMDGRIESLAATTSGWIAVGSATSIEAGVDYPVPAIWTSADGVEWSRVQSESLLGGSGSAIGAADHSGRVVVAGYQSILDSPTFWYSDDGSAWIAVPFDADLVGENPEVNALLAHFNAGYVAAGTHAWYSPNGKEWAVTHMFEGTAFGLREFDSGLLAGGVSASTGHAAVWVSDDIGSTWALADVASRPDLFSSSSIRSIIETRAGFVAVGSVVDGGTSRPAAWKSEDAVSWHLIWVALDGDGELESVVAWGSELIAVGTGRSGSLESGVIWQSADLGSTWVEYVDRSGLFASLDASGAHINGVHAAGAGAVLAVGDLGGSPAVWVGSPTEEPEDAGDEVEAPLGWTCQARIDNGAAWSLGSWDETAGVYTTESPLGCLDLLEIHMDPQRWKVVWEGSASTLEVGLLLVFEEGIHGTVYAETEVSTESGEWVTPVVSPVAGAPFTFVSMPHSFDTWNELVFKVTPCSLTECG